MEKAIGTRTLEVVETDITTLAVDAIVNAANDHLWMGAGVAGAIKRRGGVDIEKEAVSKAPIAIGEAISTRAGKLPAACVIHAAVMGQDLVTDAETIERATRSALRLAEKLGCHSVALPAFGTGVGGFPIDACAARMVPIAVQALRQAKTLDRVVFALYGRAAYDAFVAVVVSAIA
ncbi:MAG: macro domain-containing protein [Planctomycetes bacterium]|nr:macro domain-containing protein [Planctomycetota bacterium]MBI3844797.1 macro domain-containing protein [Planctomycetota bacterium]